MLLSPAPPSYDTHGSDWQQIVNAIAAMPGVTVTDPLTVGMAFGRPATYP